MGECVRACARACVPVSECVSVHVCTCVRVCECVCACVYSTLCMGVWVFACVTTSKASRELAFQ